MPYPMATTVRINVLRFDPNKHRHIRERREVPALYRYGALAVTEALHRPEIYSITHIPSGMCVASDFGSVEAAKHVLRRIYHLTNWKRTPRSKTLASKVLSVRCDYANYPPVR